LATDNLKRYIREYKAAGVVDVLLTACHTYGVESAAVKKAVEGAGAAYMALETDYSTNDAGQLTTRIEAFVETLSRGEPRGELRR
jgi:benzoyl-CoA reductase/2-hydroxyglutaryl-CoA dehydratase subunit BcrC/BadD/HgdB